MVPRCAPDTPTTSFGRGSCKPNAPLFSFVRSPQSYPNSNPSSYLFGVFVRARARSLLLWRRLSGFACGFAWMSENDSMCCPASHSLFARSPHDCSCHVLLDVLLIWLTSSNRHHRFAVLSPHMPHPSGFCFAPVRREP